MANTTVQQLHDEYPLGDAEVGDYFVGQKLNNPAVTGTLNYAPKLEMDPAPYLAGTLVLNGNNIAGNFRVQNFDDGTNASTTTYLRGDGTWVDPTVANGTIAPSTTNYFAYYSGPHTISGKADLTGLNLGTPLSGNLSNCTAYPVANLTGLGTNVATTLALAASGASGGLARTGSPVLITPNIGTPSVGILTSCTDLPISTGLTGGGTGVVNALTINPGTAGSVVLNGGALGTPSTGDLANTNNLPIAGINATGTPNSGNFLRGDGTWAAPSGSGSVNSGTINQLAYYAANGTVVSGLATANNAVLATDGSGVPSLSTTPNIRQATATSLAFSNYATGGIIGTSTNNSASAGYVGEYITSTVSSGSPVSLTTATAANITSISLTAGDWDVEGLVGVLPSTTNITIANMWASTTSATLPSDGSIRTQIPISNTVASSLSVPVPTQRVSVSSTTTVYLSAQVNFSSGTVGAWGRLFARRIR